MKSAPLISVLMPVYQGGLYLKESLDSIFIQTYNNFELIIIDDYSSDNTYEVIKSYNDDRIYYYKNEKNIGLVGSLNRGLDLLKGDYILRMDQDDICYPYRFEKQLKFMEENPEIAVCGTWFETFGDYAEIIQYPTEHEEIYLNFLLTCPIGHPTAIIRNSFLKDNFLRYNPYFENSEDTNLWVRIAKFGKFANIPEVLLKYRMHSKQITTKNKDEVNISFNRSRNIHFRNICKLFDEPDNIIPFPERAIDFSHLKSLESKIITLINKNKQLKIFKPALFNLIMSKFWLIIASSCIKLKTRELKLVLFSRLTFYSKVGIKQKLYLIKKCIINEYTMRGDKA